MIFNDFFKFPTFYQRKDNVLQMEGTLWIKKEIGFANVRPKKSKRFQQKLRLLCDEFSLKNLSNLFFPFWNYKKAKLLKSKLITYTLVSSLTGQRIRQR